ncbi:hypothetical protein HWV03_21830 [Moritella sp. 36]|uniref:phage tail assembly chaperone n=1 Tax=Moritella sp. 36 TaxID=2746233 RepID=UPI001BABCF7B|nr:phage tail assembly chaperone [Moritella sp. 36]QUM91214.1 hypothetical protein HWV03_21830 [Moritella sp. 36]
MWDSTYGDSVKSVRSTLCKEADILVNTALDKGVDATPFRQYRQALRDIPQTFSDPEAVTWPVKPSLPQASV